MPQNKGISVKPDQLGYSTDPDCHADRAELCVSPVWPSVRRKELKRQEEEKKQSGKLLQVESKKGDEPAKHSSRRLTKKRRTSSVSSAASSTKSSQQMSTVTSISHFWSNRTSKASSIDGLDSCDQDTERLGSNQPSVAFEPKVPEPTSKQSQGSSTVTTQSNPSNDGQSSKAGSPPLEVPERKLHSTRKHHDLRAAANGGLNAATDVQTSRPTSSGPVDFNSKDSNRTNNWVSKQITVSGMEKEQGQQSPQLKPSTEDPGFLRVPKISIGAGTNSALDKRYYRVMETLQTVDLSTNSYHLGEAKRDHAFVASRTSPNKFVPNFSKPDLPVTAETRHVSGPQMPETPRLVPLSGESIVTETAGKANNQNPTTTPETSLPSGPVVKTVPKLSLSQEEASQVPSQALSCSSPVINFPLLSQDRKVSETGTLRGNSRPSSSDSKFRSSPLAAPPLTAQSPETDTPKSSSGALSVSSALKPRSPPPVVFPLISRERKISADADLCKITAFKPVPRESTFRSSPLAAPPLTHEEHETSEVQTSGPNGENSTLDASTKSTERELEPKRAESSKQKKRRFSLTRLWKPKGTADVDSAYPNGENIKPSSDASIKAELSARPRRNSLPINQGVHTRYTKNKNDPVSTSINKTRPQNFSLESSSSLGPSTTDVNKSFVTQTQNNLVVPSKSSGSRDSSASPTQALRPLSACKPRTVTRPNKPGKTIAKLFVICCNCKYWHDLPSALYHKIAFPRLYNKEAVPERKVQYIQTGNDTDAGFHEMEQERLAAGISPNDEVLFNEPRVSVTTEIVLPGKPEVRGGVVKCPWCEHEMSRKCCEGWTTVTQLYERHH